MPEYITKDSGVREEYETGARRDVTKGRGRFDLLPFLPLQRLAQLYERGAEKYEARNWQKGIPLGRYLNSAIRHLFQLLDGQQDEDHGAAVLFNVCGYIWTRDQIEKGKLPAYLDDLGHIPVPAGPEKGEESGPASRLELMQDMAEEAARPSCLQPLEAMLRGEGPLSYPVIIDQLLNLNYSRVEAERAFCCPQVVSTGPRNRYGETLWTWKEST